MVLFWETGETQCPWGMLKACYIYGLQDHTEIATKRIVV